MALTLRVSTYRRFNSVRSLATECFRVKHIDKPYSGERLAVANELRPWERAINRCQLMDYLDHQLQLTTRGTMALSRHPLGKPLEIDAREKLTPRNMVSRDPSTWFATEDLIDLAYIRNNEDATFLVSYMFWHGKRHSWWYGTSPDRALAKEKLGREGGGSADLRTLPLFGPNSPRPEGANTGAPPQPPYSDTACDPMTCNGCDNCLASNIRQDVKRTRHAK